MKKKNTSPLLERTKGGLTSVIAALICIVIGLIFGLVFLFILDAEHAWKEGFVPIIQAGFRNVGNETLKKVGMNWATVGQEIVEAAPLIMTGLSVAFAFKTGLFNIGAAGQYTVGAFGGLFCAIVLHLPWWACLLAATLFGALWGAIPGLFKAYLNINEVITSIMFNWIGLYAVNTLIYNRGNGVMYNLKQSQTYALKDVSPRSLIPSKLFGWDMYGTFKYGSISIAIFLAILVAVVILVILNKTTFGYELKACGHNASAAKYAGINEKRSIVLAMVIAGALAGFGAGLYYLAGGAQWDPQNSTALPSAGFDGISVALLASLNPVGCIFSGLFISHLSTGGAQMTQIYFPSEIADVVSGIIIYLCAFSSLFKGKILSLLSRPAKAKEKATEQTAKEKEGNEQ